MKSLIVLLTLVIGAAIISAHWLHSTVSEETTISLTPKRHATSADNSLPDGRYYLLDKCVPNIVIQASTSDCTWVIVYSVPGLKQFRTEDAYIHQSLQKREVLICMNGVCKDFPADNIPVPARPPAQVTFPIFQKRMLQYPHSEISDQAGAWNSRIEM